MSDREIMNAKRGGEISTTLPTSDKKVDKKVDKLVNYFAKKQKAEWGYSDTKFNAPDPKLHQTVSFIKSGVRILGYACIPFSLGWATVFLILSEGIGIIEELGLLK